MLIQNIAEVRHTSGVRVICEYCQTGGKSPLILYLQAVIVSVAIGSDVVAALGEIGKWRIRLGNGARGKNQARLIDPRAIELVQPVVAHEPPLDAIVPRKPLPHSEAPFSPLSRPP